MKQLKKWSDLPNQYPMVLFNNMVNVDDGAVLMEWMDQHNPNCEAEQAREHIENCDIKDCKECAKLKDEFGEYPECNCEPYQWYLIEVNEFDVEHLNKEFNLDIFLSDTLDAYVLPVYHYGTAWNMLLLKGGYSI